METCSLLVLGSVIYFKRILVESHFEWSPFVLLNRRFKNSSHHEFCKRWVFHLRHHNHWRNHYQPHHLFMRWNVLGSDLMNLELISKQNITKETAIEKCNWLYIGTLLAQKRWNSKLNSVTVNVIEKIVYVRLL